MPPSGGADPRIAMLVASALADCDTILNVGAGIGAYEPPGKQVTAVEPSARMREQRVEQGCPRRSTPALTASRSKPPRSTRPWRS